MTASAAADRPAAGIVRSVAIVANPAAGSYRAARIETLAGLLRGAGLSVTLRLTEKAGDLSRFAAEAAAAGDRGAEVLVVAGGDGSINEAVSGLLALPGQRPALAVLPSGTANVLAHELALPRRPEDLALAILRGRTTELHLGRANGRPFVLMASAGFDAAVVHAVPPAWKRRVKQLAFVTTALRLGFRAKTADLAIEADGVMVSGRLAVVAKAASYGGPFRLVPGLSAREPGLVLVTVGDDGPFGLLRLGAALLTGRISRSPLVDVRKVGHVRMTATRPVPVQVDGEAFGTTPLTVEPESRSLAIVVP